MCECRKEWVISLYTFNIQNHSKKKTISVKYFKIENNSIKIISHHVCVKELAINVKLKLKLFKRR